MSFRDAYGSFGCYCNYIDPVSGAFFRGSLWWNFGVAGAIIISPFVFKVIGLKYTK